MAPGGPVEQLINKINHQTISGEVAMSSSLNKSISINPINNTAISSNNHATEIEPELLAEINKTFGFNLSLPERFLKTLKQLITFDLGTSFYQDKKVGDLIIEKLPVSISLGFWSLIISYLIAIPLGIKKAVKCNSSFDLTTTTIIIIFNALPSFLLAIGLIILFCGGNFLKIFPLKGLISDNFTELNWYHKILDYFWHLTLPILAMIASGIASLTIFCKNTFLEEFNKTYVSLAISKGLGLKKILYHHIARNALMLIIGGLPAQLITIMFTSSMLIEIIFSLDGIGLLGYEATISRDYPVIFGTIFCFSLIGLIANIISDICYRLIDPRINYSTKS